MKRENLKVRAVKLDDIDAIMAIENESFDDGIKENKEVFVERMDTFNDGFLVLVDDNDSPLAYICSELWEYKKSINKLEFTLGHSIVDKHNINGNELYISSTALSNKLRGRGYGHLLVEQLLVNIKKNYPNVNSSILVVAQSWTAAQKIYRNNGFVKVGSIKDFFVTSTSTTDAIVMRKKVEPI